MLVLSRKATEGVVIYTRDGEIRLLVVAVNGNRVKLGVTAPASCRVVREELTEQPADDRPTKSDVLRSRRSPVGCCDRYADNQNCNCLRNAREG